MKRGPLKVFYSYAHEDEDSRDQLDAHLELLARRNLIVRWHDRHIVPGTEWSPAIQESLDAADIILLLVTNAFMASEYVKDVEIPSAMAEHEAGNARVVPILLEDVPNWSDEPFAKLELLPRKGRPVSEWEDEVQAFADIARGVGRVAKDIIIEGGGPFEFGPHEFTEAELSPLTKVERERAAEGLTRLRDELNRSIPARSYEENLLVATWSLRKFGAQTEMPAEGLFFIAQVISAFDLVALQEIDRDLSRLEALLEVLGPDWGFLTTDVAPGRWGNNERFAILYYEPRVEFRHFSGHVILPSERGPEGEEIPARQLARPPLVAAFRAGDWEFQVCTTHIVFGGATDQKAMERRLREISDLGAYLERRSRHEDTDLLVLGDFQLVEPGSQMHEAVLEAGIEVPEEVLLPSSVFTGKYYDLIGYVSRQRKLPLSPRRPCTGTVDIFRHVLRDEDLPLYRETDSFLASGADSANDGESAERRERERYRRWKTYVVSDHFPLWAEIVPPKGTD